MVLEVLFALIKIGVVWGAVSLLVAYMTYFERKLIGHMQVRLGPMRVGPHGLLQPIAGPPPARRRELDKTPARAAKDSTPRR